MIGWNVLFEIEGVKQRLLPAYLLRHHPGALMHRGYFINKAIGVFQQNPAIADIRCLPLIEGVHPLTGHAGYNLTFRHTTLSEKNNGIRKQETECSTKSH